MRPLWTNTAQKWRSAKRGTRHARGPAMISILCIIGGIWLGGSVLLLVALAMAAKRPMPKQDAVSNLERAA
jgi:hypothetical protein